MDITRRGFLGTLATVAATAVTMPGFVLLSVDDRHKLIARMRSGVVENEVFLFDGPVRLGLAENLIFRNCVFAWRTNEAMDSALTIVRGENLFFRDCVFETRDAPNVGVVIALEQSRGVAVINSFFRQ